VKYDGGNVLPSNTTFSKKAVKHAFSMHRQQPKPQFRDKVKRTGVDPLSWTVSGFIPSRSGEGA
jgi:hypothetical protein